MKKTLLFFLLLSLIGAGAGYWLGHSYDIGLCHADYATNTFDIGCHQLYNKIGGILFYSMQAIVVVFVALLFLPKAFGAWKRFAIWYIPLMLIYFAIYKNEGFFSVPEESVYRFLSAVYLIVSLAIILFVSFRKNKAG